MLCFFAGWTVCLTILLAVQRVAKSPTTKQVWKATENVTLPSHHRVNAEFLTSTREDEILHKKKDVKIDDILK